MSDRLELIRQKRYLCERLRLLTGETVFLFPREGEDPVEAAALDHRYLVENEQSAREIRLAEIRALEAPEAVEPGLVELFGQNRAELPGKP